MVLTEGTEQHNNIVAKKEKKIILHIKKIEQNNAMITNGDKGKSLTVIDEKECNEKFNRQ